jgi:hypothetical protein
MRVLKRVSNFASFPFAKLQTTYEELKYGQLLELFQLLASRLLGGIETSHF